MPARPLARTLASLALAGTLLGGCSTSSGGADGGASTTARTVSVRISGSNVDGPTSVTVDAGTSVTLKVTSAAADEVHVHGYDKELELTAGTPATLTFVADEKGAFEVETHESGLRLFVLNVR